MRTLKIHAPIWNGKNGQEKIGVGEYLFRGNNHIQVEITYKDRHGNRLYPDKYIVDKITAFQYPRMVVGQNTIVRVILLCVLQPKTK